MLAPKITLNSTMSSYKFTVPVGNSWLLELPDLQQPDGDSNPLDLSQKQIKLQSERKIEFLKYNNQTQVFYIAKNATTQDDIGEYHATIVLIDSIATKDEIFLTNLTVTIVDLESLIDMQDMNEIAEKNDLGVDPIQNS